MFYKDSDIIKEVSTPTVRLRLLKNDIVHYTYLPNITLGKEEAEVNHQAYLSLQSGIHPLLIDSLDEFISPTKEYVDYIKSKEPTTPLIGRAIVTDSMAVNLLLSIFYKVTDTLYPIKVFKTYKDAEDWLLSLMKDKK